MIDVACSAGACDTTLFTTFVASHDVWKLVMMQIQTPFQDKILSESGPPFPNGGRPENDIRKWKPEASPVWGLRVANWLCDPKTIIFGFEIGLVRKLFKFII